MRKKKVVAIIPARMAASRFPGKPLKPILGLPMVEHVRRRALLCQQVDDVYVATCDKEIVEEVSRFGGNAVMTSDRHLRCTDRVEEAMQKIDADIVVILQGDEPLFDAEVLQKLLAPMLEDDTIPCANLLSVISDPKDFSDVDIIKTVLDQQSRVLYYSRGPIPYFRVQQPCPVYRQTGLSAFTKNFLHKFAHLSPTPLEIAESIDFLRIREHGYPILGVIHDQRTVGVDRPDDIAIVENILKTDPRQQRLYQEILKQ